MEFTNEQKQAWAELCKDQSRREDLAQVIVDFIQPNHLTNTYMSLLLKTRALQPGDSLVKKVRKGITVHTLVPGANHLASEITVSERMNYVLDGASVKVTFNEWELERGEIGTLQSIQQEMRAKLADYYFNKVFTALSSVWNGSNTPYNFTHLGTKLTDTALEDAIDRINYVAGGAKLVIGTRRALQPITKFGAFWDSGTTAAGTPHAPIPSVLEEIRQTGWVGKYYGVPVVGLDQIFDNPEDNTPLLPEDKVLVIGHEVGEFITYGDPKVKQWQDWNPTPPQWFLEIYQQFGIIVDRAEGIYVIKVTN